MANEDMNVLFDDFIEEFKKQYIPKEEPVYSVDNFIKQHDHINYTEIIIFPSGEIIYAIPSHVKRLEYIYMQNTGKTETEVINELGLEVPIDYLMKKTRCVCVWYRGYQGAANLKQIEVLKRLFMVGMMKGEKL